MDPAIDDPMSEEDLEPPDLSDVSEGKGGGFSDPEQQEQQEEEEDVYAYADPNDPVDRVLDVYLSDQLEDHLYLLQYPMRPADRPPSTPSAVKVKVANHLLEVQHAIKQGGKHFDSHAPPQLRQPTQTHTGSRVRPATNFAFGVVKNNEFHLTPVHATMQMRPSFQHIDDAKALEIEVDLDDPANQPKAAEKPQQVSFKKKESERATAARKSTYAYKKSIEDAEPWVQLEVHGQNDQPSLDEFSRMFFGAEDDETDGGGAGDKVFPDAGRYLQGLDYMEEYDENGESFSAGIRGRSVDDSIDIAAAGSSSYSPVKIPSAPLQQLGGDSKVIAYLKLAHVVPFSMLVDVTLMSEETLVRTLSAEGRQRGLLLRGNWAARALDVWPKGPPHAADCLSVAQVLLHRHGVVSRTDLQRRFPDLSPVTLKEVLSNIAELDAVGRRWVPKLRDGIDFGLRYPGVVELEEQRWLAQATNLEKKLGKDILAPPSCEGFHSFLEALHSAGGLPGMALPAPVIIAGKTTVKKSLDRKTAGMGRPSSGGIEAHALDQVDAVKSEKLRGGKASVSPHSKSASSAKRHFKPKRRPTVAMKEQPAAVDSDFVVGAGGSGGADRGRGGSESRVKEEQDGEVTPRAKAKAQGKGNSKNDSTASLTTASSEEEEAGMIATVGPVELGGVATQVSPTEGIVRGVAVSGSGTAAATEVPSSEGIVRVAGGLADSRPRRGASAAGEPGVDVDSESRRAGVGKEQQSDVLVASTGRGGKVPAILAKAKEEPIEKEALTAPGTVGGSATGDPELPAEAVGNDGEGLGLGVGVDGGGGGGGGGVGGGSNSGRATRGKAKEEPVPRPKIRPRAPRAKPKGK